MISLALPKGSSLEQRTLELFTEAGLVVCRPSSQTYRASIDYQGGIRTAFYKPREIPFVVERGHFDFGLTGADWIEESGAKVERIGSLNYSKTYDSWRVVLAVPADHPARHVAELHAGLRVATEYPNISRTFFADRSLSVELVESYGATEAKIPELADAVIDVVETGTALRHNGLRIIETLRTCTPQLIANPAAYRDPARRATIEGVVRLLSAVHAASARVLLTVRVALPQLPEVSRLMPSGSWRIGTGLPDDSLVVLQGLVTRRGLVETIDRLMAAGALDVLESTVAKLVTTPGNRAA